MTERLPHHEQAHTVAEYYKISLLAGGGGAMAGALADAYGPTGRPTGWWNHCSG